MKFNVCAGDLAGALSIAGLAASKRNSILVLSGARLDVDDKGELSIACTDMETSIVTRIDVLKSKPGRTVVGAAQLAKACTTIDGNIAFEVLRTKTEDPVLIARQASTTLKVRELHVEDFPLLPWEVAGREKKYVATVGLPAFNELFGRIKQSYSKDASRPVLTGVQISTGKSKMLMAATDSYRLSVHSVEATTAGAAEHELLVPGATLAVVHRLAKKHGSVQMHVLTENEKPLYASFSFGDTEVWSRIIDGQYPNWRQLIPEAYEWQVLLPRERTLQALTRITKLGTSKNSPLRVGLTAGEEARILYLEQDGITLDEQLDGSLISGRLNGGVEIGLNPEFFQQAIESLGSDVTMHGISPLRPTFMTPDETFNSESGTLLMPIRLAG